MKGTDRGVLLPQEGHQEVADVALQLGKYCIDDPVKSPLIFGGKKKMLGAQPIAFLCGLVALSDN